MLSFLLSFVLFLSGGDKEAPKIVSLEPENQAVDIDANKSTRLVVQFDRAMSNTGWSLCGGGPSFPPFKGKPRWENTKKLVVDIELQPDHEYRLGLNCEAATNFRSAEGVPLQPVAWYFSTAPANLPDPAKQKAANRKSLEALKQLLPEKYSYYDLRVRSWDELYRKNEAAILDAKTTRGWAIAVSKMLAPTQDLHLYLKFADQVFGTGKRAVDPLFRERLISKYISTAQRFGEGALQGRTEDGFGYLMIPAWSNSKAIDPIEQALAGFGDCKALIVDVRPNSGGDELLAQRIAAWFVEGSKTYAKHRTRLKAGKDGFSSIMNRQISGNGDPQKRLSMPVIVLSSPYVMSSNESFILMMRQANDCTVVGEHTFGSSGNPKPFELPNGVTICIPSWQDLRLDGTCFENEGIAPDVEVKVDPKQLEDKDPILEKALDLLRKKS